MRPQIIHNPSELATLLDMNGGDLVLRVETETLKAFDPAAWLKEPGNIAIRIGNDLAMFDYVRERVYGGHVYFSSRGGQALETARTMLRWMLTKGGAEIIVGETPVKAKAAWLFVRMLGFRKVGEIERDDGVRVHQSVLRPERLANPRGT